MAPPHATLLKFGYPATCLAEWQHWAVLLRPQQVTLGALVLASRHDATSLSSLPADAFAELHTVTTVIERGLRSHLRYDKINYLALMMVDPQVHFHVLPRYAAQQDYAGVSFVDAGWPGPPDLKSVNAVPDGPRATLHASLVDALQSPR
jgi:diadenosine tetraphosphate (Ap4A) HIT family hydrolase